MNTTIRMLCAASLVLACGLARAEDCAKLSAVKLEHAAVSSAEVVAAGAAVPMLTEQGVAPATGAYCRIQAVSRPTPESEIHFELWVPLGGAWNGNFEQVGNGGFAGVIPYRAMARVLARGFAVAGTDDGHRSNDMTDAAWALNHEERVKDYGWRAVAETAVDSKRLLQRFKARAPLKSYFVGCSDGGREAFIMAQRYPTYFDGIVAGAPAYAMTRLLTSGTIFMARLGAKSGHLSHANLLLLQSAALRTCGKGARFLTDPLHCRPDLEALRCTAAENDGCLTDAQVHTAQLIYEPQLDPVTGAVLHAVLPGAEALKGSWDVWLTGGDDGTQAAGVGFTWNYLANMVMNDPHFDFAKVTKADVARGARRYAPIMDAGNPDLSAFKAHGGKLIQYHGWNDPAIPPGYSVEYRARVVATMGTVDDFYRLYMVPGMLHCAGGDAPTGVNWQDAIEAWVQQGTAPDALVASDAQGANQTLRPFMVNGLADLE